MEPDPPLPNVRAAGLGAAILSAPPASRDLVGRWQYSSGADAADMEWKDLPADLAEDVVLPEGLASVSHLGPVKVTRYLRYLACEIHNIRPDSRWEKVKMQSTCTTCTYCTVSTCAERLRINYLVYCQVP